MAMNDELAQYEALSSAGKHDEAATLAYSFLWKLYDSGEIDKVKSILVDIVRNASNGVTASSAWLKLGDVVYTEDLYDKARTCYLYGLNVMAQQEPMTETKLRYGIGNTYFMEGDYLEARAWYSESLAIARQHGYQSVIAENLAQLANIARAIGEYGDARQFGQESLELNCLLHRERGVVRSVEGLCNLAIQLDSAGNRAAAEEVLALCHKWLDPQPIMPAYQLVAQAEAALRIVKE